MWKILRFTCSKTNQEAWSNVLLSTSVGGRLAQHEPNDSTFEIIVATSPDITVNTNDGGQAAPVQPTTAILPSSGYTEYEARDDMMIAPSESLRINPSWLWTDTANTEFLESGHYDMFDAGNSDMESSTWWDFRGL